MSQRIAIIGSGINSLTAAVVLAKKGHAVTLYERNAWLGGNIQTVNFGKPGYLHERFSGFHPLFTVSPFYQEYQKDLEAKGLEYLNTEYPTGVLLPDGRSTVVRDTRERTVAEFNKIRPGEGDAYAQAMERFDEHQQLVFGILNSELWSTSGLGLAAKGVWDKGVEGMLEFAGEALPNGRKWLDNTFADDLTKAVITPWVLHTGLGPDDQASSLMLKVIMATFEQTGMPVPRGGGSELVRAMMAIVEEHGGRGLTNHEVSKIILDGDAATGLVVNGEKHYFDTVLANVTPTALYQQLLPAEHVPPKVAEDTAAYRYGRGNMQIQLSLNKPPAWPNPDLLKTGIVHLTPGLNGVSRAVNAALNGLLPAAGTIVVGQHTALDPSRAPDGGWTIWCQLQELPAYPTGDEAGEIDCHGEWTPAIASAYADRIVDRMDAQLPGLKASIIERNIISPRELGAINPNLVGGDPYSGAASLDQYLFWRPLPALRGHETPFAGLYHIGASTHPGPGLNGTAGYLVAKQL